MYGTKVLMTDLYWTSNDDCWLAFLYFMERSLKIN